MAAAACLFADGAGVLSDLDTLADARADRGGMKRPRVFFETRCRWPF
jgi:hypothetical protein